MEKLKDVIQNEMDHVTKMMISTPDQKQKTVYEKWLQSLQKINDVCKVRNRY